jgi:hypothetical protein
VTPYLKNNKIKNKHKKDWGMVQVTEHLAHSPEFKPLYCKKKTTTFSAMLC